MDENSSLEALNKADRGRQLWQTIGAIKLAEGVSRSLSSQSLHALERVRDEKQYLSEPGYETFSQFLDRHPESPMGHDTFRRRINLLETEGDVTFDLLTSLRVPISSRQLLAGNIAIDGDEVEIAGVKYSLSDKSCVKEIIRDLAAKTAELHRTNARKDKKLAQGEKDYEALKRRAINANPEGTETGQAYLTAAGALSRLREILEGAPDDEKLAMQEPIFNLLRNNQLEMSVVLGVVSKAEASVAKGQPDSNDDEAAALMEEL